MNNEIMSTVITHLETMMIDGAIKPEAVPSLVRFLEDILGGMNEDIIKILTDKVTDWEDSMGENDKSLYTLGIRQAIDVLRGDKFNHAKEYKPLNSEDFRPSVS